MDRKRILIVDDEKDLAYMIADISVMIRKCDDITKITDDMLTRSLGRTGQIAEYYQQRPQVCRF